MTEQQEAAAEYNAWREKRRQENEEQLASPRRNAPYGYTLQDFMEHCYSFHHERSYERKLWLEIRRNHTEIQFKGKWQDVEQIVRQRLAFQQTKESRKLGFDGLRDRECIEIKHWKRPIGANVVDAMAGKMERTGMTRGFIVGTSFSINAYDTAHEYATKNKTIRLVQCADLFSLSQTDSKGEQEDEGTKARMDTD